MTLEERYAAAAHRMQSAVAFDLTKHMTCWPNDEKGQFIKAIKDVRVGLNSAMSTAGGLAKLLIDKGVITHAEYHEAVVIAMEREADERCAEVCARYDLPSGTEFA